jgi:hypothetical protein
MDIVKQNMLMTSELMKVVKILEENNIESISFKGPVLSYLIMMILTSENCIRVTISKK